MVFGNYRNSSSGPLEHWRSKQEVAGSNLNKPFFFNNAFLLFVNKFIYVL